MRVLSVGLCVLCVTVCAAEPEPLTTRWTTLYRAGRASPQARPLPANGPLYPYAEMQFTGPMPAHPFVLGNFAADGKFGIVNGGVELISGKNAALRLVEQAGDFELEGRIAMKDFGGWFLLVGWDEEAGNGYAIHNCTMKESGSPWFITELRGREAVQGTNQELKQLEWRRFQDVKVSVQESKLLFQLGGFKVLDNETLPNYRPGAIVFGVYDTKYGPRPVHIESLRVRAPEAPAAANPAEGAPAPAEGATPPSAATPASPSAGKPAQ
jgi:hypothetical protein